MQHSSRQNPCPICYRDKDDKCRWSDETILCYLGDRFHPPLHLLIGDSIDVNGFAWKLSRMDAGFSANSYLFVKKDNFVELTPLQKQKQKDLAKKRNADWNKDFSKLRGLVYKSFSTPCFENLTYQEFMQYKKITHEAIAKCEEILSFISMNRSYVKLKKFTIAALTYWRKSLIYQLQDFVYFEYNRLGVFAEDSSTASRVQLRKPSDLPRLFDDD
jgi:hypothetical protein